MKPFDIFDKKFVDAKELYTFLGVKPEFSDWIVNTINNLKLKVGKDYLYLDPNTQQNTKYDLIQYMLLSDKAKEVAMMEGTQMGREVREYFLNVEKCLNQYTKKKQKHPDYKTDQDEIRHNFQKLGVSTTEIQQIELEPQKIFYSEENYLAFGKQFPDFVQKAKALALSMSNFNFKQGLGVSSLDDAIKMHHLNLSLMNKYINERTSETPKGGKKNTK